MLSFQSCVAAAQNEDQTSIFCTQYGNISDMNLDLTFCFQVSSVKYFVFDSTSWHLMIMMMMMKLSSHFVFKVFFGFF